MNNLWTVIETISLQLANSFSNNYGLFFEQNEQFSNILWNNIQTVCRTIFEHFVEQYSNSLSNNFRTVLWTQILSVFRAHVSDLSRGADPKLRPARTATYFSSRLKVPFKPNLRLLRFSFCVRQLQLNGW